MLINRMLNRLNDIMIGLLFLCIITIIIALALMDTGVNSKNTYSADFNSIDGISPRSIVYMTGVRVGRVRKIELSNGFAKLTIAVDADVKIPVDSMLQIETQDFFSSKSLTISAGFQEDYMSNGDKFQYVQNSVDFIGLLNNYMDNKINEIKQGRTK